MTTPNNNLQDAHLKAALQHAPDVLLQPNEQIRHKILAHAKQATTPRQSWLTRLKNWIQKEHFASTQWAGLAGLTAMFFVAILLWRQHPEDTVWISATPKNIPEISQTTTEKKSNANDGVKLDELSKSESMQAAPPSIAKADGNAQTNNLPSLAESKLPEAPATEAKKVGRKADKNESLKDAAVAIQQNQADELSKATESVAIAEAPVATAPAPMPKEQTATEAESAEKPSFKQKARMQHLPNKADDSGPASADAGSLNLEAPREEVRQKNTIVPSNSGLNEHENLVNVINTQGGAAIAQRDIQAGKLRLLQLTHQQNLSTTKADECHLETPRPTSIDAQTGYTIEYITVCTYSEVLRKEVDTYNQTMKNWYLQHKN